MSRIIYNRCWAILCGAALLTIVCSGQSSVAWSGELAAAQVEQAGNDVLAGLEHTREFVKDGQWADAVETLSRIMENHRSELIEAPVSAPAKALGFAKFTTVGEHCQRELAAWHARAPEALATYRRRVDPLARQWYEQAIAAANEVQLQRIVDELFLSSSGDQALLQLGELALERGNYLLARSAWERLSRSLRVPPAVANAIGCAPGCSWWTALRGRPLDEVWPTIVEGLAQDAADLPWLAYPDSEIPCAAVRARLIVLALLEGDHDRAALEFELLRRLHPGVEGTLAGRSGKYVELVADVMRDARQWSAAAEPRGWATLGGAAARNRVANQAVDVARKPLWQIKLPRLEDDQDLSADGVLRVGERADGLLSYHVAVSDGVVFVQQPGMIRAFDVATGKPAWPLHQRSEKPQSLSYGALHEWTRAPREVVPRRSAHIGVPRYGVTIEGRRLFARMGTAWTGGAEPPVRADQRSFLIGIDLRTQKLIFDQIPPGERGWEFEASPIVTETHLFVSMRRRDPASARVRVACFSIQTGRLVWKRDVLRGEVVSGALFGIANSALTLAGDMLYYNTNLGAVAALRAGDGALRWIYRYPRAGMRENDLEHNDRHWARDQTPCLMHHDLVIVAPADCRRIFALDAPFGQMVWATAADVAADAIHLAGVGQGHLLASGDYLYWIDLYSGVVNYQFPPARTALRGYAGPTPRGYGRAVLAGDQVFWPTHDFIYVFQQRSNRQVRQKIELRSLGVTGGNLVIADETLLVAGADRLTAFNSWGEVREARSDGSRAE